MKKVRLLTIVLAGILLGTIAVKIQQGSGPLDEKIVSSDDGIRAAALRKFSKMSDEKKEPVIDALVKRMKAKEPRERQFALYAMRKSGFASRKVVNQMINGLSDGNEKVREEAKTGLKELGDAAIQPMIEGLTRGKVRSDIMNILADASPQAIPPLVAAVRSNNPLKTKGASRVLGILTNPDTIKSAQVAVPALAQHLKSTDTALAVNCAFAIHHIDPKDARPVPLFLSLIKKDNWESWEVRGYQAADALSGFPDVAPQVVPIVSRRLRMEKEGFSKEGEARKPSLARLLEKIDPRPRTANGISWDLKNADPVIRYRALVVLTSTPTVSPAFAPQLVALLDDRDPAIAARSLVRLITSDLYKEPPAAPGAFPKYLAVLDRVDDAAARNFRFVAARGIADLGAPVLPVIVDALKAGRIQMDTAVRVMEHVDRTAVPFLQGALNDRNADVRLMAALGLAKLDPDNPRLKPEFEKAGKRTGFTKDALERARKVVDVPSGKK